MSPRFSSFGAALGALFVAAVACSGGDHLPGAPTGGAGTSGRGPQASSGGAQAGEGTVAGAGPDAENGGQAGAVGQANAGEGGEIIYEMGGAPPQSPPGVCDPMLKLGATQKVLLPRADVTLLSMTPDERSVAYTTGSADTLALHVADRASPQDSFVEVSATVPGGYEAASGASLSATGTELILVLKDHSGFGQLSRQKRGDDFSADADVTPFAKLNALKLTTGHSVGWPVLSQDGKSLYFVSYFGDALVNQSARAEPSATGVFDIGIEIDPFTLGGKAGEFKLLCGISADERAIFYFDQATGHAAALFRSRPGGPFYDPLDLGALTGVASSADCSHVYTSAAGELTLRESRAHAARVEVTAAPKGGETRSHLQGRLGRVPPEANVFEPHTPARPVSVVSLECGSHTASALPQSSSQSQRRVQ
jgi:hypothetical protein